MIVPYGRAQGRCMRAKSTTPSCCRCERLSAFVVGRLQLHTVVNMGYSMAIGPPQAVPLCMRDGKLHRFPYAYLVDLNDRFHEKSAAQPEGPTLTHLVLELSILL